jgi:hypothetical protein
MPFLAPRTWNERADRKAPPARLHGTWGSRSIHKAIAAFFHNGALAEKASAYFARRSVR